MFSLSYFNQSDIDLRATETFGRGSFIESYIEFYDIEIALYSLDTFYVEVYIKTIDSSKVFDIVGISPDDAIDKYCL
jgi:hypothetical protein